jgi:hypothetical protein
MMDFEVVKVCTALDYIVRQILFPFCIALNIRCFALKFLHADKTQLFLYQIYSRFLLELENVILEFFINRQARYM